jgi:dolichol kinase
VLLAALAVLFNLFALQTLLGRRLFRPGERIGRLTSGIVLYPLSVLGLLLVFRHRLDIAGAAWGILAAGDGMATITGRRLPIAAIPWNRRKSVGGSLAFFAFGGVAAVTLAFWCRDEVIPPAYTWFYIVAPLAAAAVAAAVETIPVSPPPPPV